MKRKGFTLIELLAVIVILAIILAIAVPSISNMISSSTKSAFESNAKLVLKSVNYKKLENVSFDETSVTKDNITSLLGLSSDNYESVNVIREDGNVIISIVGKNKWDGLVACGTSQNMKVVTSLTDCSSDLISPVITLNGSNSVSINQGDVYVDVGATALDNRDGDITSMITVTSNVNPNVPGTYTVTYSVTDIAGNKGTATRTVTVIDTVAPVITFGTNGNTTYAKSRSTTVSVTDAGGIDILKYLWNTSTTDLSESSFGVAASFINGDTISTPAGVTGSYYLWVLSKDRAGNTKISRSNAFNIDNTAPIITITGSNPVTVNKGSSYTDAGATATDNVDSTVTVTSTGTVNPNVLGTYTITYNATDLSGNTATPVTRTINVVDASAPTITILGSNPITINQGSSYTDAGATALDDTDGNVTSKITTTSNININVVGTYTITYTVKDNANNTATLSRTVIVKSIPNAPVLASGMTPIKWVGTSEVATNSSDSEWYDYDAKKWANAKTADGSYWVWVPRYIYKISSGWHSSTAGTIEVQFSRGTNDNWNSANIGVIDTGTTSNASNNKWTNHPAFTFGTTELTGMWVAKFEASAAEGVANGYSSEEVCTNSNDNVLTKTIKIVPNVLSWRCINSSNMFTNIRNMETKSIYGWTTASGLSSNGIFTTNANNVDTHLIKNVEWGAAAYLSNSMFGKNGAINPNTSTYTGGGASNEYLTNTSQSTTGNIYGIYDMSGGATERTSAYVNNANGNLGNGSAISNADDRYKDVYTVGSTDNNTNNYANTINKKGDALWETSSAASGTVSWYSAYADMPQLQIPWFYRGGYTSGAFTGIFAFGSSGHSGAGFEVTGVSFRPVLLVGSGL